MLEYYVLAVLLLFLSAFFIFVTRLGKNLPILELMALIAAAQWGLGPLFAYNLPSTFTKYTMAVPLEIYFQNALPGIFAFLFFLIGRKQNQKKSLRYQLKPLRPNVAYTLIVIGLLTPVISPFLPSALRFLYFLMSSLVYVGLLVYYSNPLNRNRNVSLLLGLLWLLFQAAESGIFHTLILWGAIFFCFYRGYFQKNLARRLSFIGIAFTGIFFTQVIKSDFRSEIGQGKGQLGVFVELILSKATGGEELLDPEVLADLNVRLNQGWIIARIYNHVPMHEPYANGETIKEAVVNAILPRLIFKDKKKAGGQENFERFTGEYLRNNTSMGISVLGEAFANFGKWGGTFFMAIYALVISSIYYRLIQLSKRFSLLIYLIPLVFLQVIKAETELYVVLNHLLKSLLLIFLLFPVIKKWSKIYLVENPLAPSPQPEAR